MKRLLTLIIAIILMLTITISASAADFVESITNKGAPELVVIDQLNGKDVVGFITGPDGDRLSTEFLDCLIITSVSEAPTDPDIPEDAKEELLKVYEELNKPGTKLSEVCPELTDIVKEKWGKDKTADDLVIKDLFDLTDYCDDLKEHLKDGAILDLTFDLGIGKGVFVTAMVYVDGKWVPVVDCINNGDGTVTVKFDQICPVAFLVPGSGVNMSTVSPTTNDASGIIMWSAVMLVSLVAIMALVMYRRRVNG
ncbi:MAG: hypothetical protein E7513_03575 [Ruminococcaceae bacterium]|nr:hypothetical protein [Oscillospiraceae bacterium]